MPNPIPKDLKADRTKFDALLLKIARTPALKESERKIGESRKKVKKSG
jgi:hypothetical protein